MEVYYLAFANTWSLETKLKEKVMTEQDYIVREIFAYYGSTMYMAQTIEKGFMNLVPPRVVFVLPPQYLAAALVSFSTKRTQRKRPRSVTN